MKAFVALCLLAAIYYFPQSALAEGCSHEEAVKADKAYADIKRAEWTWQKLYKSFRKFGHCADAKNKGIWDAELATAYDGAVQHLLLNDWKHFSDFIAIDKKADGFRSFVLSHINEDMSPEQLAAIKKSARERCPRNGRPMCDAVAIAAATP